MAQISWHNLSGKEIVKTLKTNLKKGLSEKNAIFRRKEFGKNKLPEKKAFSNLRLFLEQFKSPLVYILVIASFVSFLVGEITDASIITITVLISAIIGFLQEKKANDILKNLKKVVQHTTKVLRNGSFKIINTEKLVPGDIIILEEGNKVPADARIIESKKLKINEMALTGEWIPSNKNEGILPEETILADRENIAFMGTIIEQGEGKAVVFSTGEETEIGRIAKNIKESRETKTPFQRKIKNLSKVISIVILFVCLIIFIEGLLHGFDLLEIFSTTVALAVAGIPEALPITITVILALGTKRILKKRGLVRKLSSTETLGSTSVICTDKTGTLTEGTMKVDTVLTPSQMLEKKTSKKDYILNLRVGSLFSKAFIEKGSHKVRGTPTEKALFEKAISEKAIRKNDKAKKLAEIPFNSTDKFTAIAFKEKEDKFIYFRGAPEIVLENCKFYESEGKIKKIKKEKLKTIKKKLDELAQKGLRIIGTAYKKDLKNLDSLKDNSLKKEIKDLIFTGFIALKDPVRKEVKDAISICQKSGIKVIIITGDHKLTAKNVAKEIGIKNNEDNILEGKDLDSISEKDFQRRLEKTTIYARVSPEHKYKIIQAWQDREEVVAMTGDGINDATALKKADIGLAVGSGTEVAQEASDLILLDDNFSVIIDVIKEGRGILDNIRKATTFLLSDGLTEILLIGTSIITNNPLPLSVVQILWVNLIEDSLPDIALAFEPKEKDLMKRKVHKKDKDKLLTREMKVIILAIGFAGELILIGLFFWLLNQGHNIKYIRTLIFACLTFDSLIYVFSCKSLRKNLWDIDLLSNKFLVKASAIGFVVLILSIYNPFLQSLLKTVSLSLKDWGLIIGLGILDISLIETIKHYFIVRKDYE